MELIKILQMVIIIMEEQMEIINMKNILKIKKINKKQIMKFKYRHKQMKNKNHNNKKILIKLKKQIPRKKMKKKS